MSSSTDVGPWPSLTLEFIGEEGCKLRQNAAPVCLGIKEDKVRIV